MKKADYITMIEDYLFVHPEKTIVIKHIPKFKNGRWGLHGYCITYDKVVGDVVVEPWAGANVCWKANFKKLTKKELMDIWGRILYIGSKFSR